MKHASRVQFATFAAAGVRRGTKGRAAGPEAWSVGPLPPRARTLPLHFSPTRAARSWGWPSCVNLARCQLALASAGQSRAQSIDASTHPAIPPAGQQSRSVFPAACVLPAFLFVACLQRGALHARSREKLSPTDPAKTPSVARLSLQSSHPSLLPLSTPSLSTPPPHPPLWSIGQRRLTSCDPTDVVSAAADRQTSCAAGTIET